MRAPHRHSAVFSNLAGIALALTADPAIAKTTGDLNQDQTFIYEYMVTMAVLLPILLGHLPHPFDRRLRSPPSQPMGDRRHQRRVGRDGHCLAWLLGLGDGRCAQEPNRQQWWRVNLFINDLVTVQLPEKMQAAATPDIGERLLRLKTLRDNGVITDDEYARLRQPLLGMLV